MTLSALELCAVAAPSAADRAPLFRAPLDPLPADANTWPSLTSALRELAASLDAEGGTLNVVIAAPLVEVRALELPPLSEPELRALLARNAPRYFLNARLPQIVGVAASSRTKGETTPAIAAAAPMRLVNAINAAARDAGWRVASIVPVESALAAAALAMWPAFAKRAAHVLVLHADRTDLMSLKDGRVAAIRKFRAGASDASLIADAVGASRTRDGGVARVAAFGPADSRRELARSLSNTGISLAVEPPDYAQFADQPERIAAAFAASATELLLRTEDMIAERRARANRLAIGLGIAAAVLVLVAAGMELWGVRRELHTVQAQRAALHPQLAVTLVGQTSVETAYQQLATLSSAERTAPNWTGVLVHISQHLDTDAYFTSFRGRGDSLVMDGIADHAALVFKDLEQTPGLSGVGGAAPVRREAPSGSEPTEHFTIAARMGAAPRTVLAAKSTPAPAAP